jgi:mono/diheme cytochrome c family protein
MNRYFSSLIRIIQILIIVMLATVVYYGITLQTSATPVHALPEYATRTSEPCATCHVNPGGGGPRTLRGSLWAARGRPDEVPIIPGLLLAPGVTSGAELYDIACAGCHGFQGEGLFGMGLVNTGVPKVAIRTFVQQGIVPLGMPAFKGQFTDEQLETLVDFVAGVANSEIEMDLHYPLPPAALKCVPVAKNIVCGGN